MWRLLFLGLHKNKQSITILTNQNGWRSSPIRWKYTVISSGFQTAVCVCVCLCRWQRVWWRWRTTTEWICLTRQKSMLQGGTYLCDCRFTGRALVSDCFSVSQGREDSGKHPEKERVEVNISLVFRNCPLLLFTESLLDSSNVFHAHSLCLWPCACVFMGVLTHSCWCWALDLVSCQDSICTDSDHCHTQSEIDGSPSTSLSLLSLYLLSPGGRVTSSPPRSIGVDSESYDYHKKLDSQLHHNKKHSLMFSQSGDRARIVTETHHWRWTTATRH